MRDQEQQGIFAESAEKVLTFPYRGLGKPSPYADIGAEYSPGLLNVRPFDKVDGRVRGGRRHGTAKLFSNRAGAAPVRLIDEVAYSWEPHTWNGVTDDDFARTVIGPNWTAYPTGSGWSMQDNHVVAITGVSDIRRRVFRYLPLSVNRGYTVSAEISVPNDANSVGVVDLMLCLDNDLPDGGDQAIRLLFVLWGKSHTAWDERRDVENPKNGDWNVGGWMQVVSSGSTQYTADMTNYRSATLSDFTLSAELRRNRLTVKLDSTTMLDVAVPPLRGERVSLGIENPYPVSGGYADAMMINSFEVDGHKVMGSPKDRDRQIFHVANGVARADNTAVTMGSNLFSTDRALQSAELHGELFIADYSSSKVSGNDGVVGGSYNNEISGPTWTGNGIDTAEDQIYIYSLEDSSEWDGVFNILSVTSTTLTIDGSFPTPGKIRYEVRKAPLVYDPASMTVEKMLADYGSHQLGCSHACVWNNRLVIADTHRWYMSRLDEMRDFDYSKTDMAAPVAGSMEHDITALIPWTNDFLIIACANSLWLMRGDPMAGGKIDNIARKVGVVGPTAWDYDSSGTLWFLDETGLFRMAPGEMPAPVSYGNYPQLMDELDTDNRISLVYNRDEPGVHIYETDESDGTNECYIYFLLTEGWFKDSYPSAQACVRSYGSEYVIMGGLDGYLRIYDASATQDDGVDVSCYVYYAPFRAHGESTEGVMQKMIIFLDHLSGALSWSVYAADTNEKTVSDPARSISGSVSTSGLNIPVVQRIRGGSLCLYLHSSVGTWAVERIVVKARPAGRVRI